VQRGLPEQPLAPQAAIDRLTRALGAEPDPVAATLLLHPFLMTDAAWPAYETLLRELGERAAAGRGPCDPRWGRGRRAARPARRAAADRRVAGSQGSGHVGPFSAPARCRSEMRYLSCSAVCLVLALAATSWAAGAQRHACAMAGYRAIERGSESVLLQRVEKAGPRPDDGVSVYYRVCHRPTGRISALLRDDPVTVRISGRFVAYTWDSPEDDCGYGGLDIVDARSGRQSTAGIRKCGYEQQFRPFVVKPSGALAWMQGRRVLLCRICFTEDEFSVARPATLASGSTVARHSLRGTRRGVVWRQAGSWRGRRLK
jgi:hypothetical protein